MNDASLTTLLLPDSADLAQAMEAIRANGEGLVLIHDEHERVVGLLTDGDIRNVLLEFGNMHLPIVDFMNRDYVWVSEGASKEQTLKLLDRRIRAIPVLDEKRQLVSLVRTGYMEPRADCFIRAKAPARISLAGGGTDYTNYFINHGGVALSTTLAQYSHVVVRRRGDRSIVLHSYDRGVTQTFSDLNEMAYDGVLDLIKAGIRVLRPEFGFELWSGSDFLPGSGLGGSATVLAAMIGALNELREDKFDRYAIAELAFEAERIELGVHGGWQDQYSTVFGGFNFIQFNHDVNTVTPLRLDESTHNELEERFLLCYSGRPHLGEVVQSSNQNRAGDDPRTRRMAEEIKDIALAMKTHLIKGRLDDFGRMLNETWRLKKALNPDVTGGDLDEIYDLALRSGAEGGRLLGTGGGGYFLFFVRPFERHNLLSRLAERGLATQSVNLDLGGLRCWQSTTHATAHADHAE